jgi:hypothetical protein
MQANHGCASPGALVCVDTESTQPKGGAGQAVKVLPLRLGVARYCRMDKGRPTRHETFRFTSATAFWDWLYGRLDPRRSTWLWAHNLGWDLTVLRFWRELESKRFVLALPWRWGRSRAGQRKRLKPMAGFLMTQDPPSGGRLWDDKFRSLRLCDTFNWAKCSLADLGHQLGVEKLPFPGFDCAEETAFHYCERDCAIVEAAVLAIIAFVSGHDLGNMKLTPAAQALSAFRHLPKLPPVVFLPDDDVVKFERRAYVGARRAVYFKGRVVSPDVFELESPKRHCQGPITLKTGPVYQFDLTAAYASVMRGNRFPSVLRERESHKTPDYVYHRMKALGALAWVKIESPDRPYPRKVKGGTRWYVGNFQTALCGPELLRAIQLGDVKHVYRVFWYHLEELFTDFVDKLCTIEHSYDRTTERFHRTLAKTVRNALHGKFGQRKKGWLIDPRARADRKWGTYWQQDEPEGDWYKVRSLAGQLQRQIKGPRVDWTFPAISAYVLAHHRERMRQLRERAGLDHCLYEDADTLHVDAAGARRLRAAGEVDKEAVGKLRLVKTGEDVEYVAPQCYRWGDRWIVAGLPARAVHLEGNRWKVEEFLHLDANLRAVPPPGGTVLVRTIQAPIARLGAESTKTGWTRPERYEFLTAPEPAYE